MKIQVIRQEANHMATIFDFRISCPDALIGLADRTLAHCHGEVTRLESELSEFLEHSPVFKLNHLPSGTRVVFSKDAFRLLVRSFELRALTEGAFDPLSKSRDSSPGLKWDETSREVWRLTEGTWLGFGAIGKGYALDRVRELIEKLGFQNYLLSAGGSSIALSGEEAPRQPWKWGWSWKKNEAGENLGIVLDHDTAGKIALGVSGTHEKGRHLIDFRGKGDSSSGTRSALVATASAADADALSTALFISGWEESKVHFDKLPLPPAVAWVDETETPHWNGTFNGLWNRAGTLALAAFSLFSLIAFQAHSAFCDEGAVDLDSLGGATKSFTPYVFERNRAWILLPLFILFIVIMHLKKTQPLRDRKKLMKKTLSQTSTLLIATLAWIVTNSASAGQIEPLGKAVAALLGTTKAFKKTINDGAGNVDAYYSKGASGKADKVVVIEKGIYQPDCTHTWAIGVDAATSRITEVRPIEMSCPHAYPTKSASFLDQYKGKGPADVATLDSNITIVAKATGTSQLATAAVKRTITAVKKGQL